MVLTNCWRCLRTPPLQKASHFLLPRPPLLRSQSAPFATTSALLVTPPKKTAGGKQQGQNNQKALAQKQKSSSNKFHHKKKKRDIVVTKRYFQEGERKQLRRTIVLTNSNAPAVVLPDLSLDMAGDKNAAGAVFEIPDIIVDKLRVLEAFKVGQHWPYFRKPSTLVRRESVEIGKLVTWINENRKEPNGEQRYARCILDGTKGSGRSILLAQAMAWALQSDWVVISIPNGQDLVIGHTEYEWDPTWNLWVQKGYTCALLGRIFKANNHVLRDLEAFKSHRIGKEEVKSRDLLKLVDLGIQDPMVSHDVFMALLAELSLPGRPPVLFTLDNLNQISLPSAYRDPNFMPIHSHSLALPSTFLSYLSSKCTFPHGLALAATSSTCARTPALSLALKKQQPGPWDKIDPRIAESVEGAEVLTCKALKIQEVKAMLEWFGQGGILKSPITPESVTEQYVLSSGNPRELLRSCLRLKY